MTKSHTDRNTVLDEALTALMEAAQSHACNAEEVHIVHEARKRIQKLKEQ